MTREIKTISLSFPDLPVISNDGKMYRFNQ
jgi:hypothetical protein